MNVMNFLEKLDMERPLKIIIKYDGITKEYDYWDEELPALFGDKEIDAEDSIFFENNSVTLYLKRTVRDITLDGIERSIYIFQGIRKWHQEKQDVKNEIEEVYGRLLELKNLVRFGRKLKL